MRFAGGEGCSSILSDRGMDIINNARELCYLTQVVIRLFEDTSRGMEDPRRFRVEILFSPGATATPLHIDEANRNADLSRLDTAPLETVNREGLTCKDVEDFFCSAIIEGGHFSDDGSSIGTADNFCSSRSLPEPAPATAPDSAPKRLLRTLKQRTSTVQEDLEEEEKDSQVDPTDAAVADGKSAKMDGSECTSERAVTPSSEKMADIQESDEDNAKGPQARLESKYFWSAVAAGTLLLGAGCLVMALSLGGESRNHRRRTTIIRT